MKCNICINHQSKIQHLQRSLQFINGTKSYKADAIAHHENSEAHKHAEAIQKNTVDQPDKAPGRDAEKRLNKMHLAKLQLFFKNAHALAKFRKPIRDYTWLCQLD